MARSLRQPGLYSEFQCMTKPLEVPEGVVRRRRREKEEGKRQTDRQRERKEWGGKKGRKERKTEGQAGN